MRFGTSFGPSDDGGGCVAPVSGQRINETKKKLTKMREIAQITTKETYLRPKQCVLTRHLDLEMMEMGASWVGLVKESTKEKKN